jgi:hypothetical protein
MEWQPIESAPKDGQYVIVTYFPANGRAPVRISWWGKYQIESGDWFDGWRISHRKPLRFSPTHWMPLPKPPQES